MAIAGASGAVLFASNQRDPRARRPTDIAIGIGATLTLVLVSVLSQVAGDLDGALSDLLAGLPPFLDALWRILFWAPVLWALTLLVVALARRRVALARDMVAGVVIAVAVGVLVGAIMTDDAWASIQHLGNLDGPPVYPPGALTATAALLAVASPHLSRPFRHLGRWLLLGQFLAMVSLGATQASGGVAALAAGLVAAAAVHLLVGSPGGRPTVSRIELALRELGVDLVHLEPATMHAEGVVRCTGTDALGPIDVKVYGRDAWDAQLLTNVWRVVWYRGAQRTVRLSRVELVEHEGFLALLAERAGVRVPSVVTAGSAGQGDALIVVRRDGRPLAAGTRVDERALASLWDDVARLHDAGIVLRRVDFDHLLLRDDGTIGVSDMSSASVLGSEAYRREDETQVLAVGLVVADEDQAVAAARHKLGDEGVLAMLPYLQEAAVPVQVRAALDEENIDLDDVRNRVRTTLGAEEQQLIKLRRVTLGSLLNLALLALAAYFLIGTFADLDLATFADALADARWWWLVFALVLAQALRIPAAVSTLGSIDLPLPLGPLTALQFAICYVNLAIPSTAARVAINVRFFQRFGVPPATAMTAGVIDSVSGFVVQIVLFLTLFLTADIDLHLNTSSYDLSTISTIVLVALAVIGIGGGLILAIPALRRRVVTVVGQATAGLTVLRRPVKLLQLFGGNLVTQVLFAVTLGACATAFHESLPLSELILINTVVSLFAGLLPVPGGIGVSEAGLTAGLTAAGVPTETAFAIALAYRFASFYLPPIWGSLCYRWLVRRRYL